MLFRSVAAADSVSTPELRLLAEKFSALCIRAVYVASKVPPNLPDEKMGEAVEPMSRSWATARAAYDELRDQVQRETRA